MKLSLSIYVTAVVFLITSPLMAGDNVYSFVLPKNVSLGMSAQKIKSVRPKAKRQGIGSVATKQDKTLKSILTEVQIGGKEATSYQYHFTNETLGAVTMSVYHLPGVQDQRAKNIYKALPKSFTKVKDKEKKIVRLSRDLEKSIVTAELWKDKKTGNHLFFVATTEETTAILFDPKLFSDADFFILADKVPDEIPDAKTVRESVKKRGNAKVKDVPRSDLIEK